MEAKITTLRKLLDDQSLDAVLVSSVPNIIYLTKYAGFSTEERDAYLLVTKNNAYIFTHALYAEEIKTQIKDFTLIHVSRHAPFPKQLEKLLTETHIKTLGIEEADLTVSEYKRIKTARHPDLSGSHLKPADLTSLRIIKSDEEIKKIQKACQIGDQAFEYILTHITSGITELALALELELFIRKQHATLSFPSIVAFGENSAVPHHHTSNQQLRNNAFVLLDFGVKYQNYCSDMTRTIFFGAPTEKQKKIYETVRVAQQKAITFIEIALSSSSKVKQNREAIRSHLRSNSTIPAAEIDTIARNYITSQGFPAFPHSLGHGIGIEVHEAPALGPQSKDFLTNGMVFSIEPGIYFPSSGGVRIEDLFVIQNNKLVKLINAPSELIVIK